MYWGPHQSSRGNRLASMTPTIMRKAGDHVPGAPRGVFDQSYARTRAPISPPFVRGSAPCPSGTASASSWLTTFRPLRFLDACPPAYDDKTPVRGGFPGLDIPISHALAFLHPD